jgi:hypothetical protein
MATYLGVLLVKILSGPVKKTETRLMTWSGRKRFAHNKSPKLLELVTEINNLLDQQRTDTFPYVLTVLTGKLSDSVKQLVRFDSNVRDFQLLQAWAGSLRDRCAPNRKANFWDSATDLSRLALQFSWVCTWLRNDVILTKGVEENTAKQLPELKPDWDAAIQKISDFTFRVERFAKLVNRRYGTTICSASFQPVKPI